MKTYRYLIALFATLVCISFTACSDDSDDGDYDDGPSTSESIVGTWIYNSRDEYRVYTFYSNGTGTESESPNGGDDLETWDITYNYDESDGTLIITDDYGERTFCYDVEVTANRLTFTNDDWFGGTVTLMRDSRTDTEYQPENVSLVGTWKWTFPNGVGYDIYVFQNDGNGVLIENPGYGQQAGQCEMSYIYNKESNRLRFFITVIGYDDKPTVTDAEVIELTSSKLVLNWPDMYDEVVTLYRVN